VSKHHLEIIIDGFGKSPISTKTGSAHLSSRSGHGWDGKPTRKHRIVDVVIHEPALDKHNMTASEKAVAIFTDRKIDEPVKSRDPTAL